MTLFDAGVTSSTPLGVGNRQRDIRKRETSSDSGRSPQTREAATESNNPMQATGRCNGCVRSDAGGRLKLLVHAEASKCILVSRTYDMAGSRPTRITYRHDHDDSASTLCAFGEMLSLRETVYYAPAQEMESTTVGALLRQDQVVFSRSVTIAWTRDSRSQYASR